MRIHRIYEKAEKDKSVKRLDEKDKEKETRQEDVLYLKLFSSQ